MSSRTNWSARIAAAVCAAVSLLALAGAHPASAATGPSSSPATPTPSNGEVSNNPSGKGTLPDLGLGIKLLDASVARRNDPRAKIEIDDFIHPGTSETRKLLVSDITPKPMHLSVYAAPASIANEQFIIAPEGKTNELTSWITVTPSTLNLKPESSAVITATINVPSTAVAGERYGAIVAELGAAKPKAGQVTIADRVATRIYLDVGPGGEPPSNFSISTLTPERLPDGTPAVAAKVTNTGQRALDLNGTLNLLNGPGGLRAGPYDVPNVSTLGIGQTGDVVVPLDKQTPAGPWLARLALESGYIHHAVQGRISFPAKSGTTGTPVKASPVPVIRNRHILIPLAIGFISLAFLLLLLLLLRRRCRDDDEDERDPKGPGSLPRPRANHDSSGAAATRTT